MADPSHDLLWSLRHEPHKWHRRAAVAFRAHERHFPEVRDAAGKVVRPAETVRVTDADLDRIAAEANRAIDGTGTPHTFTLGHRKFDPDYPEKDQPPLLGFCRNYRVETVRPFGGQPYKALVYDEYASRTAADKYEVYTKFPFRSAEYHPQLGIHGVAALQRPPALNLGAVIDYADGTRFYQMGAEPMGDDVMTPDEEKLYAGYCDQMKAYSADVARKFWKKYESGLSAMGPGNGTLPADNPQLAAYQASIDARIKELTDRAAAADAARLRAECQAQLDKVSGLVKFDPARELNALVGYQSDTDRAGHIKYMLDHYEKLPTGPMIRVYSGEVTPAGVPAAGNDPTKPPANYDQIMTYMRAHPGMQWHEAEAKILAK